MNILWDFDGTLFDTYPGFVHLFKMLVDKNVHESEILLLMKETFSKAATHYHLSKDAQILFELFQKHLHPSHTPPFAFVEDVLRSSDKNFIVTHKKREAVEQILSYHHLSQYFTEIVSVHDGYPRKPDNAMYRYLHEKYGVDLVVGDRTLDILPAKELGMKTCLFQSLDRGADYHIDDYRDLIKIISSK